MVTSVRTNSLDSFGVASPSKTDPIAAMEAAGGLFGLRKMSLTEYSGVNSNPDLHVVVRTDTGEALSTVGNNYVPFDNESFFGPTVRALVEETGAEIERFQMLADGTRSFMRLSWPEDRNITIGRANVGDIVGRRCTLSTSHDGTAKGQFSLQMLRLVCSNGMVAPVGNHSVNLVHSACGKQQLVDLQKLVPVIERYVRQFEASANILAETNIRPSDQRTLDIVKSMVDPSDRAGTNKINGKDNRAQERINRVMDLFAGGQPGADKLECKDTGWGLLQAGIDYFTHEQGTRGENRDENRFKSLLPGGSANKEIYRAWGVVTEGLGLTESINQQLLSVN